MKVLGIPGSLRTTSSNAALLRAAAGVAPPGTELVIYDGVAGLPYFSPDLDVEPLPPPVAALRAQLAAVDAWAISSPEYAHGIPGALKNALDWLVSATEPLGKPVLLVSASPSGAPFAHAHLLEVLRTMASHVIDAGGHVFSRAKLDDHGHVTDPALLAALATGFHQLAAARTGLLADA
ncbi:MAG TPA: NADPH-dependent FMN reductase [Kofleriaceae bacterium]|nr:NADPH-dependent FMN reductase [Kofleriaceae bacterium]